MPYLPFFEKLWLQIVYKIVMDTNYMETHISSNAIEAIVIFGVVSTLNIYPLYKSLNFNLYLPISNSFYRVGSFLEI